MNTKSIILNCILFFLMSFFGLYVVSFSLIDPSYIKSFFTGTKKIGNSQSINTVSSSCTNGKSISDVGNSDEPVLSTLSNYQEVCKSFVTNRMMIFTDMPKDNLIAKSNAKKMAQRLFEFSKYSITPVVMVEPSSDWGLIDFQEFNTGFYDGWIQTYFKTLVDEGVTHEQIGIWVPFSEANIPLWNRAGSTPKDFAYGVNRYGKIILDSYPNAHVSVLLNSATYDNTDFDWLYGEYVSLKPYVEYLDKNIVKSFGLQGFPWVPKATSASNELIDASQFLNHKLAKEAAEIIGVNEVWFNTGTFSTKYASDEFEKVNVNYQTRKTILDDIAKEALSLENDGFNVWINLFSEDKSDSLEQTDWSYFTGSEENKIIFKDFVRKLDREGVGFSLFDREKVRID